MHTTYTTRSQVHLYNAVFNCVDVTLTPALLMRSQREDLKLIHKRRRQSLIPCELTLPSEEPHTCFRTSLCSSSVLLYIPHASQTPPPFCTSHLRSPFICPWLCLVVFCYTRTSCFLYLVFSVIPVTCDELWKVSFSPLASAAGSMNHPLLKLVLRRDTFQMKNSIFQQLPFCGHNNYTVYFFIY